MRYRAVVVHDPIESRFGYNLLEITQQTGLIELRKQSDVDLHGEISMRLNAVSQCHIVSAT